MATYTVTLDSNGVADLDPLAVIPGDQVTFCYQGTEPAIICVNPPTVFGAMRFEIPPCPHVLTLTVMSTMPLAVVPFTYKVILNDRFFRCSALAAPGAYPGAFTGGGEVTGYQ